MDSALPAGWTIERVRLLSGDESAMLLSPERLVVIEERLDYAPLQPDLILAFHDMCLVRVEEDWFMGQLEADGSIICWASYGTDLHEAILGL
jgi:hypothetical protein